MSATPAPTARPTTEPAKTASPLPRRTARPSHRATPGAAAIAPASRASAKPASEEALAIAGSSTNWLTVLNAYRTRLNVPPVVEDPVLSRGDLAHAKYLMTNYQPTLAKGGSLGFLMHEEDESKPGYSPEGLKAAHASDVTYQFRTNRTDAQRMEKAIEVWISAPFHRASIVNPDLRQVGFAEYCKGTVCVAALDWASDLPLPPLGGHPLAEPVEVPPDGVTVKSGGFDGEWPDPLSACDGYSTLALAITLQLGMRVPAKITDASVTQTTGAAAGTRVVTCAFDSEGYTNPDGVAQTRGREVLNSFGEVVVIVRDPLAKGETYRAAMTVNGKPYNWSFTAAP